MYQLNYNELHAVVVLTLKKLQIMFLFCFVFSREKYWEYRVWPNYYNVCLGFSKLLGKLVVKFVFT